MVETQIKDNDMYVSSYEILEVGDTHGRNSYGNDVHVYSIKVASGEIRYMSRFDAHHEVGDVIYVFHENKRLDLAKGAGSVLTDIGVAAKTPGILKVVNEKNIEREYGVNRAAYYFLVISPLVISVLSIMLINMDVFSAWVLLLSLPLFYFLLRKNREYAKHIKSIRSRKS